YQIDAVAIGGCFREMSGKADHIQSGGSFERAMNVKILGGGFCLVQIGGEAGGEVGLWRGGGGICSCYKSIQLRPEHSSLAVLASQQSPRLWIALVVATDGGHIGRKEEA